MTDEDLAKIGKLIDQKIQPITDRLDDSNYGLSTLNQRFERFEQKTVGLETGLQAISQKINHPQTGLQTINQKLDAVIGELALVHKKVDVTYDFLKFQKEKNEAEFDEIRQHTKLPPAQRESLKFTN